MQVLKRVQDSSREDRVRSEGEGEEGFHQPRAARQGQLRRQDGEEDRRLPHRPRQALPQAQGARHGQGLRRRRRRPIKQFGG